MSNLKSNTEIKRRRNKSQLDTAVMEAIEKLVVKSGFENVQLQELLKEAKVDPNIFYRHYGSFDVLYRKLASRHDYWINDTVDVSNLETLGDKKFFIKIVQDLYKNLDKNGVMQKIILWGLTSDDELPREIAISRDTRNIELINYYIDLFEDSNLDVRGLVSVFISSIYFLTLYSGTTNFCTLDLTKQPSKKIILDTLEDLANMIFDRLEQKGKLKASIALMREDGISDAKIAQYLGISPEEIAQLS